MAPLPDSAELLKLERGSRRQGTGLVAADLIGIWRLQRVWPRQGGEPSGPSSALLRGLGARLEINATGVPAANLDTPGPGPASARQLAAELWQRFGLLRQAGFRPLWQLDGRPMSGDVGVGTARAAVALLQAVRPWAPPGPLQLAGGTNGASLTLLPPNSGAAGVAFGGRARSLLQPLLIEAEARGAPLRDQADLRRQALDLARGLVDPWRQRR
jgi:hypothetical protein